MIKLAAVLLRKAFLRKASVDWFYMEGRDGDFVAKIPAYELI